MKNKKLQIDKRTEKQLLSYIDKNRSKGYSLNAIKKVLVKYGCDSSLAGHLIDNYRHKNVQKLYMPGSLLTVFFVVILMLSWSIGVDVGQESDKAYDNAVKYGRAMGIIEPETIIQEFDYIDEVSLELSSDYEYIWVVGNPGPLKTVSLEGVVSKKGSAKVYLEYED